MSLPHNLSICRSGRVKSVEKEHGFQGHVTSDDANYLDVSFATVDMSERTHVMISDSSSSTSSFY